MNHRISLLACCMFAMATTALAQNERERVVREDRIQFAADTSWIYNNFEQGMASAKASGKPLLVLIRCVP